MKTAHVRGSRDSITTVQPFYTRKRTFQTTLLKLLAVKAKHVALLTALERDVAEHYASIRGQHFHVGRLSHF